MPRNVRNFWIEGCVDGRASAIAAGPRRGDGGFSLTIYQRDKGGVTVGARLSGWLGTDGRLFLDITTEPERKGQTLRVVTER